MDELPEGAWALRGERGLTYADALPDGNALTAGEWWPEDYCGRAAGLGRRRAGRGRRPARSATIITVSVLGVERTARIANFRRIDWESMGFNYVLVFSPNTLADAPHNLAATITLPPGARPAGLLRELVRAFPSSSVIEVGPLLTQARAILDAGLAGDPRRGRGGGAGRASRCCSARSPRRAPRGSTTP